MKNTLFFLLCFLFSGYVLADEIITDQAYIVSSSVAAGKSLIVRNSSLNRDTAVVNWTETNVNAQRWILSVDNDNKYQLTNAYSGKILYRKGTLVTGAKVCQYDKNDLSAGKWEITPVEGRSGYFYISQLSSNGLERFYLEVENESEGATLELYTKKEGPDAERQVWKLETGNIHPDYLTNAQQEEMMLDFKAKYYRKASTGYVLGRGGWWGDAEMFEVVLDAYETTGNPEHEEMFRQLYINFISRNGTDWMYNEFNDDIAWMVIASARAYLMFGDQNYLTNAKSNFDRMYSRALLPSGMLRWKETEDTKNGTNSCINGPAEVCACYLAIATQDQNYYKKAKDLYALQRQYLYVPTTGQVYDSFTWIDGKPANYNHWASTYNQGTFLGAAVMLYNHFGDKQYKEDAEMIVKYTQQHLCDENGIIKVCQVATGDLSGFKGILMRYIRRFIVDLNKPGTVDWMHKNALHVYNNRNASGITSSAWLMKAPEDFVFPDCKKDCSFDNDPFGPSTAVSALFNAPLHTQLIEKNGFSRIEAEDFNYIKGVHVKEASDDNTVEIGNIRDGYYTGYNNVNFGNDLAKSIDIRVSKSIYRGGNIEIRLDSPVGKLIGTIILPREGDEWQLVSQEITPVDGIQDIYFVYKGMAGQGDLFKFNYFHFKTDSHTYPDITNNQGELSSSFGTTTLNNLIDNKLSTVFKGSIENFPCWIQYQSPVPVTLKGYSLTSANDLANKDPKDWKLQASLDGNEWVDLDLQADQIFTSRYQSRQYDITTIKAYTHFRLYITETKGNQGEIQVAEWQLYGSCVFEKDITADGGALSAQYTGNEPEETFRKLTDKDIDTRYVVNQSDIWLQYKSNASYDLAFYTITSSGDTPDNDPKNWILYGSEDGNNWVQIDKQLNQKFIYRNLTHVYTCQPDKGYRYFRLNITANNGGEVTQFSEWQLMGEFYYDTFYNDITLNGGELASLANEEINSEEIKKLTDNNGNTVYKMNASELPVWIQYKSTVPAQIRAYSITVSNDETKNPRSWILQGSNNGTQWDDLHTRSNITFSLKGERKLYTITSNTKYTYFRLYISRLSDSSSEELKIAEWELHGTGISNNDITSNKGIIDSEFPGVSIYEGVNRLIDNSETSKYLTDFSSSAWVSYESTVPVKIKSYSITSANDAPERDPKSWTLEASTNASDWSVIDSRTNQFFQGRFITQYYSCNASEEEYIYYRLNISENNRSESLQFAEWQLLETKTGEPPVNLNKQESFLSISFYPNPVHDQLFIDMACEGEVQLYNISGQLVYNQNFTAGVSVIAMSIYHKGIYMLQVRSGNKLVSKKIVKY